MNQRKSDSLPIKCSDISPDKIVGFGGEDNGYNQVKVIYVNSNYINNIGIDLSEGEFNTIKEIFTAVETHNDDFPLVLKLDEKNIKYKG